jgi:hypothetical protein
MSAIAVQDKLKRRVLDAAEGALQDHQEVSPIDILTRIRLLAPVNVEGWKKRRIPVLEELIQGSSSKISRALDMFEDWAHANGLQPVERRYLAQTREGPIDLQFSFGGDPEVERRMRTHYVSPALSERLRKQREDKQSKPEPPAVFMIVRDSACSECGVVLERGSLLFMEAERPLCLACARMDDLEFLCRGDAALTRRATKYSGRSAVVVEYSRSRGRYERQGILVEKGAIEQAEQECLADAGDRAKARVAGEARRKEEDRVLVAEMTRHIEHLFPKCPPKEAAAIAKHTAARGSGRVGRTRAGRKLDEQALTAAVVAAVRHNHTNYDELLASGVDRQFARDAVRDRVDQILDSWRA